jgi:hypothetical protein
MGSISVLKLSALCMPRPPDMTILAAPSSGRPDLTIVSSLNPETSGDAAAAIFSTGAS